MTDTTEQATGPAKLTDDEQQLLGVIVSAAQDGHLGLMAVTDTSGKQLTVLVLGYPEGDGTAVIPVAELLTNDRIAELVPPGDPELISGEHNGREFSRDDS